MSSKLFKTKLRIYFGITDVYIHKMFFRKKQKSAQKLLHSN